MKVVNLTRFIELIQYKFNKNQKFWCSFIDFLKLHWGVAAETKLCIFWVKYLIAIALEKS